MAGAENAPFPCERNFLKNDGAPTVGSLQQRQGREPLPIKRAGTNLYQMGGTSKPSFDKRRPVLHGMTVAPSHQAPRFKQKGVKSANSLCVKLLAEVQGFGFLAIHADQLLFNTLFYLFNTSEVDIFAPQRGHHFNAPRMLACIQGSLEIWEWKWSQGGAQAGKHGIKAVGMA
eukprot:1159794-Pelagomonas_calceolata.AAC.1